MNKFIGNNVMPINIGILPSDSAIDKNYKIVGNGSGIFKTYLPFSVGEFANTGERTLLAKNSSNLYEMTGPFAANILATRQRNGKTYGLFESQYTSSTIYSEEADNWYKARVSVTSNAILSPTGTLTADLLYENSDLNTHYMSSSPDPSVDGSSRYYFCACIKAKERFRGTLQIFSGFPLNMRIEYNLSTKQITLAYGCDRYNILELVNGWFFLYMSNVSNAVGTSNYRIHLCDSTGNSSYQGDGSSGFYVWGQRVLKADHWSNYFKSVASVVTKPGDYFYFPSASVPTWMKSKFTVPLTLNYDYPSQISTDKPIWSFQKTSQTLDTGHGMHGITTNGTYIYWCNYAAGKIQRCELDGSNLTDLVTGLTTPWDIIHDDTYLYFTNYSTKIQRCELDGSNLTDLVTGLTETCGIDKTNTNLYWADRTGGKIQRSALDGSSVTDIKTGLTLPSGLAVGPNANYIYYGENGTSINRIPLAGGTAVTLATGLSNVQMLDVGPNFIWWASYGQNAIRAISKIGGAIVSIFDITGAVGICMHNGMIIYSGTDASGTIKRLDTVTAWLATDGKIKVIDGPDTKVETDALSCDMHDDVSVTFDRVAGTIQTVGFTGDDTFVGSSWTSPDGYDVEYGCALKGAAQTDGLAAQPEG